MPDLATLSEANRRFIAAPHTIGLLEGEIRTAAGHARRTHPAGHAQIDGEMMTLLRGIMERPPGGERLLAAESAAAAMRERLAEANAEEARRNSARLAANRAAALQPHEESARTVRSQRITADMRAPVVKLRTALDGITLAMSNTVSDDTKYLALLLDIETAMKPVALALGRERRLVKSRLATAAAQSAADRALPQRAA